MKRVLLTGMSGVGKSTVVGELEARGYKAIDTDNGGWSHWVDAETGRAAPAPEEGEEAWEALDWVWREERMARVLEHVETVEPLLREVAHHEIDTNAPLEAVVEEVLELVGAA